MSSSFSKERICWLLLLVISFSFCLVSIRKFSIIKQELSLTKNELASFKDKYYISTAEKETLNYRSQKEGESIKQKNAYFKLWSLDRQFLINQGLKDPEKELVDDLMKHNELIPCKGTHGSNVFFNPNQFYVLNKKLVLAFCDDGHIDSKVFFEFMVGKDKKISWKVYDSNCSEL